MQNSVDKEQLVMEKTDRLLVTIQAFAFPTNTIAAQSICVL